MRGAVRADDQSRLTRLIAPSPPGWTPDAGDGGDGVGVAQVGREAEPVFEGAQQAVVVVGLAVGAGGGERADDRADDVAAGAEPVLGRDPAGPLVLVVDDDDDPVAAERGGGLDLGHLLGEEVVELGVAVVDRLAVGLAVVAAVWYHHVEVGYLAGGNIGVEGGHTRGSSSGGHVVGHALCRRGGRGPDAAGALDVIEQDGGVAGGVEPGQRAGRVAGAAATRSGVAFGGAGLQPHLPAQP